MAGTILSRTVAGVLVVWSLAGLVLLGLHASTLFSLDEAGFGDSYILYDVLHFQRTGVIYRDLAVPPYLPAQYSPMVYVLYSLPGRFAVSENPFVGPRIAALTSFALCAVVVVSIARTLLPRLWGWAALLTGSIASMWPWMLQLRGDFPGNLPQSARDSAPPVAITDGAALLRASVPAWRRISKSSWLRRWRQGRCGCSRSAGGGMRPHSQCWASSSSVGLYLFLHAREPRMLSQIFALSPGIVDVSGLLEADARGRQRARRSAGDTRPVVGRVSRAAVEAPGCLRGDLVRARRCVRPSSGRKRQLFLRSALRDGSAGGARHHSSHGLVATPCGCRCSRHRAVGRVILHSEELPGVRARAAPVRPRAPTSSPHAITLSRRWSRRFEAVASFPRFRGSRCSILHPALTEPYLFTYQERLGKFDPRPILDRVRNSEFDVVITLPQPGGLAGPASYLAQPSRGHRRIVSTSLQARGSLMHLPRRPRSEGGALASDLAAIGCAPISGNAAAGSW